MAILYNLTQSEKCHSGQIAIATASARMTWSDLKLAARASVDRLSSIRGQRVGFRFRSVPQSIADLAALDRLQCNVFLIGESVDTSGADALCQEFRLAAIVDPSRSECITPCRPFEFATPSGGASSVTILTSGTTGKPKAARHDWTTLSRPARVTGNPQHWMLTYQPHLYAGLQVIIQSLWNHGMLIMPGVGADVDQIVKLLIQYHVQFMSATPSFWRRLLLFAGAADLRAITKLRVITLGGEVVDQGILDSLSRTFPAAHIVHIYATTELGKCFSVHDAQEGFPTSYFDGPTPDGVELLCRDGELCVRSSNRMLGYDSLSCSTVEAEDWIATGDLLEIKGARALFIGRRTDIINVGGNKVHPIEVEKVIHTVAGVQDVRVYSKHSSIAGEVVACDVVAAHNVDSSELKANINRICATKLTAIQRPRFIQVVDRIGLAISGKKLRRMSHE